MLRGQAILLTAQPAVVFFKHIGWFELVFFVSTYKKLDFFSV